jgi:hypothetical protein
MPQKKPAIGLKTEKPATWQPILKTGYYQVL